MTEFGRPKYMRSDNGPEFVANALKAHLEDRQIATQYIQPGSPWENPIVESFHGKLRDECLNREAFCDLLEARVVIADFPALLQYRTAAQCPEISNSRKDLFTGYETQDHKHRVIYAWQLRSDEYGDPFSLRCQP